MKTAAPASDPECALVEAQLPRARACVARLLSEAAAAGVPDKAMMAALLAEVLQRLHTSNGPLALAAVFGNIAGAIAKTVTPHATFNQRRLS